MIPPSPEQPRPFHRLTLMASAFTHAVVGAGIGFACAALPAAKGTSTRRLLLLSMATAVAPDADVISFLWVDYHHMLGHRGLFHAPLFYAAAAALIAWLHAPPARLIIYATTLLAMLSHSILDAFTDGGLGVAFLAPLSGQRFFFPWQPIPVSPIGIRSFFTARGLHILSVEAFIALPALLAGFAVYRLRARE